MFYLFCGSDRDKVKFKADKLLQSLLLKKPDVSLFRLDDENWQQDVFEELIAGQTLFEKKYIVFGYGVLKNKEAEDFIVQSVEDISASANIFIFAEGEIESEILDILLTKTDKTLILDSKKIKSKEIFNIFSLADTFGLRDRRALWLIFTKAQMAGVGGEEIFWQFYRQIKNMILVSQSKDLSTLKMHPFVVKKTSQSLKNFSPDELRSLLAVLVDIYFKTRRGLIDIDIALEQFILEI